MLRWLLRMRGVGVSSGGGVVVGGGGGGVVTVAVEGLES